MKQIAFSLAIFLSLCASRVGAQTLNVLSFTGSVGAVPGKSPVSGLTLSGTTLYGTTELGGSGGMGSVFSVGVDGSGFRNLLFFTGYGGAASGWNPYGGLTLSGTTLYGTTGAGGSDGVGNVFSVGVDGSGYQNLLSFTGTAGAASGNGPEGRLTLSGSTIFGMTAEGGNNGLGNVFSVGVDGTGYQNLLSFTGSGGAAPGTYGVSGLTINGTMLYGMTLGGGSNGYGTVFSVGVDGSGYRNLLSFTGTGGAAPGNSPWGSLTLSGTTLYGMTSSGGSNTNGFAGYGNVFSVGVNGSGYRNLLSFTGMGGAAPGDYPEGSLLLSGTTLYGLTLEGGTLAGVGNGNVFSVGDDGSGYRNLFTFNGTNGDLPYCNNLTLSGGTLFGTTTYGGSSSYGTVFALTLPTPEPGTLALVGCGVAALVSYRWRRRRPRRRN